MNKLNILSLLIIVIINSCGQKHKVDIGVIEGNVYNNDYLGWTIILPEDFQFISPAEKERWSRNAKDALKDDYTESQDQISLISFKMNNGSLVSYLNSQDEYPNLYSEKKFFEIGESQIKKAILNQLNFEPNFTYELEKIDNKEFSVQNIEYTSPELGNIKNQKIFLRFEGDYIFQIITTWKTEEEKHEVLETVRNSKFKKKN
tara:strand:+ start:73 stop:681 length:609 start_codon:yes stop_codon:yes gene_type:complete